jgi:hypothetical protein
MAMNYKVHTLRSASCVSQDGAGRRLVSSDGQRWAYSRNRKSSLGHGTYEIVESWVLKGRDENGKAYTEHGDAFESHAREWTGVKSGFSN